jgi:hypothetical protein
MALTYTYEVTSLKVKDEVVGNTVNQNAVVQTYWKLTGTDEELITEEGKNSGTFSGATPFTTTTMPPGTEFVPFEDLTEEMVISWIQAVVEGNPGYKQHIDEQIQKQIDQNMRPVSDAQLPWAPVQANTAPTAP